MEPIDFTKPEAFRSASESAALGALDQALDLHQQRPAPSSDDALRLRRTLRWLLFWIVLAPLSWAALAALLAFMDTANAQVAASAEPDLLASMSEPSFIARLRLLAWMTADTLFWPVVVVAAFLLMRGLLGEFLIRRMLANRAAAPTDGVLSVAQLSAGAVPDGPNGLDGLWRICALVLGIVRIVPFVAAAFGVIWGTMAANAFVNDGDPWEALPWVTPPYLEDFQARHPTLQVEDADRSGQRLVRDGQGRSIRLHGSQLAGAQLSLAACPPDLGAAQLGGIPPYTGMACTLAQLRQAEQSQTLYVSRLDSGSDSAAIFAHFERWADQHGGSKASSVSGESHYYLYAVSRDEAWRLEMDSRQGGATSIVIRRSP